MTYARKQIYALLAVVLNKIAKRLFLCGTAVFMSCSIFYDIYFQNSISGSLLIIAADALEGCPMISGATIVYSFGMPSCSLSSGVLS